MSRALPLRLLRFPIAVAAVFSILACPGRFTPDSAADTLKTLDDAYRAAVTAHDARLSTELADVHAAHRKTLLEMRDALQGAWAGVIAWKRAGTGAAPSVVLADVALAARSFLALSVELGAISQKNADAVQAYLDAAFPRTVGEGPAQSEPVVMILGRDGRRPSTVPLVRGAV